MFSDDDVRANRDWFAGKLHAVKQFTDLQHKVKDQVGDFLIVDVRGRDAFAVGHLPGALCLPVAEIAQAAPSLPRDRELVTFCWSHL